MRTAFLTFALVLIAAAPARAGTVPISGPAWAQRAVDRMRVPVPADQVVLLEPCPGHPHMGACNLPTPDSPVYINPEGYLESRAAMRIGLYNELGGRFWTLAMYPFAIEHFRRIVARPAVTAGAYGGEVFEDAYADCALGLVPPLEFDHVSDWIDGYGYQPTRRQHRRACRLIRRVGARAGFVTPR